MLRKYKWLADTIAYRLYEENELTLEDLKDLKQEAYISLWKAEQTFVDKGKSFKNYAGTLIKRRLIYYIKYFMQKHKIKEDKLEDIHIYNVDYDNSIKLEQVSKALDLIKVDGDYVKSDIGKYATILALDGFTLTEIANTLGSHPSNVKKAIEITIKRLQIILNIKECC